MARIPRQADGGIDITALRAVPVPDPATLARWEAELGAHAGIALEVKVVPRDDVHPHDREAEKQHEPVAAQEVTATMPAWMLENVSLLDRFGTNVVSRAARPG